MNFLYAAMDDFCFNLYDFFILKSELMAEKDPVAAAAQKYKPIQSAVPGTTLGPIQINAFLSGGVCLFVIKFSVQEFLSWLL